MTQFQDRSSEFSRRSFVQSAAGMAVGAGALAGLTSRASAQEGAVAQAKDGFARAGGREGPVAIASGNGLRAVTRARELLMEGADPLDAAVGGVAINENDPEDMTVGLGGLPDEEGVVTLDSSVMHGPTHRAGAVACLRNIKNPAAVAREVARRTDHVLLVADGALKFAKRMGFEEENLLTEKARRAWVKWRSRLSDKDDWLQEEEFDIPSPPEPRDEDDEARGVGADRDSELAADLEDVLFTWGTIHLGARTAGGDIGSCTTTSGLSWKLPGRVGDSPIIGAGNYCDNDVGSAGGTGRGEAAMQICAARFIVMRMSLGDHPTDACLAALRMSLDKTKARRLYTPEGKPDFDLTLYALRKDGAYGCASIWNRPKRVKPKPHDGKFAVADAAGARMEPYAYLLER
ncbi:MAG: N(4)-(beta-N-acetylglucosaminyl)-L-asparaginase [Phycisphaerales bacterium]